MRLVLFGPPGAGKGTQAQMLTQGLCAVYIGSGDLFRQHLQRRTALGLEADRFIKQGLLVPDQVSIAVVLDKVLSLDPETGFILDGFPRNTDQAQALEDALELRSRGLDMVVHINVEEQELVRRLASRYICRQCQAPHAAGSQLSERQSGGPLDDEGLRCGHCGGELYQREDDRPEAVGRRLEVYRWETMPVLDFYRRRGLLVEVSGEGSIESVNQRVLAALQRGRAPGIRVSKTVAQG